MKRLYKERKNSKMHQWPPGVKVYPKLCLAYFSDPAMPLKGDNTGVGKTQDQLTFK